MNTEQEFLQPVVLNPGRLLQEMAASFRPAAASKGLEFIVAAYSDWHDVVTDEAKVRRVVGCLLRNAIKYTTVGSVQLMITPPDGEHWRITVEDTGVGMAREYAARIFDRCHRVNAEASDSGAEVDLPLCKQLVERLHGTLLLRSEVGHGTRFKVRLPVMVRAF